MSIFFYTITPQPETNPISYICRVFVENNGEPTIYETRNFPVLSPYGQQSAFDTADLYGKLTVSALMSEVQA
ncbi:hypothetical protein EGK75_13835 [Neisseria weixii]|uniref:Uncharacterized protein n=1 Tax=Neisseria weixii TaxID=1853276 RepID=A0A3N4MUX9_9NEIS|nr:hypothetical protein [Neisseria weixii]RPD82989.1 hypothetical protein EGK74_13900 [Neisseria weixii]RPD83124.1 hypothetical protein EGK75_13835 [Neisseria weixii]